MLHHVVLFALDPAASDDAVDAAIEGLEGLVDVVPGIHSITAGRDAGLADGNAGLILLLVADDEHAWRGYQESAAHLQVAAELVRPIVTGRTAGQLVR